MKQQMFLQFKLQQQMGSNNSIIEAIKKEYLLRYNQQKFPLQALPITYHKSSEDPYKYQIQKQQLIQQDQQVKTINQQDKKDQEKGLQQKKQVNTLIFYTIILNPHQYLSYLKQLSFRLDHKQFLIQIPYGQSKTPLSDNYYKFKVYVEQIPLNLSQLLNIHFLDILVIIYWSLRGFQLIYQEYGYFHVNSKMIGITNNAQIRVWGNQKYTKMVQIPPNTSLKKEQQQIDFFKGLQLMFNKHVDASTIPVSMKDPNQQQIIVMFGSFKQNYEWIESHCEDISKMPKQIYSILHIMNSGRKIKTIEGQQAPKFSMKSQYFNSKINKVIKFNYLTRRGPKVNFTFNQHTCQQREEQKKYTSEKMEGTSTSSKIMGLKKNQNLWVINQQDSFSQNNVNQKKQNHFAHSRIQSLMDLQIDKNQGQ